MSTNPVDWKEMLESSTIDDVFSVSFKLGGGQEDGAFRGAIGRFNWYARRETNLVRIALVQDEMTLLKVCADGVWPGETPHSGHRTGIEFSIIGLIDIDQFIQDIEVAVESIKRIKIDTTVY